MLRFSFLFCSKRLEKYSRQSDDFKKKSPSFATMSTDIIILPAKKKFCAELSRTYYRARQEKHKKTREIAKNGTELSRNLRKSTRQTQRHHNILFIYFL